MNKDQLFYLIALTGIHGVGCVLARKMVEICGTPEGVFRDYKLLPSSYNNLGFKIHQSLKSKELLRKAEAEISFIDKHEIQYVDYWSKDFPLRLKNTYDSPVLLYYKGEINWNKTAFVSVVGTRKATEYGKTFCHALIKDLAVQGIDPVIVSGLAYGIDIEAHVAALDNGLQTLAVLAHGLNTLYPSVHRKRAAQIIEQGALISEFSSFDPFERQNFLKRNRIIAGLSDATLVVESANSGGALVTADIANSYDREVFALPGNISSKYSQGCNKLIKTHKAHLVESYKDILYHLQWQKEPKQQKLSLKFDNLTHDEKRVLEIIADAEKAHFDFICREASFSAADLSVLLLNMELNSLIKSLPGNVYKALS
ncbi:MAG: DNA-protecting protein DprA [Marinilabiliales bacterium]|nr:MAG: DNA-protecting protein DprA [Marinilabiliales bacterium]